MVCLVHQAKVVLHSIILLITSFIFPWLQQKCLLAWSQLDCIVLMETIRTGSLWSRGQREGSWSGTPHVWTPSANPIGGDVHGRWVQQQHMQRGRRWTHIHILIRATSSILLPSKPLAQLVRIPCFFWRSSAIESEESWESLSLLCF